MVDIHNHVLPNIDDGSKTMEMSIDMLKNAYEQGVTDVVNTVHYQHPLFQNIDYSYDKFKNIVESIELRLNELKIRIKIHLGSEVFYYNNLLKIIENPLTRIGNGKYMLIEFSPNHIPNSHKETLFSLKMNGITPIIAHPERYKAVQKNLGIVYDWINAGCLIQLDAGSIIGLLGKKAFNTSRYIIQEKCCHIIGSDAHNNSNRNFCIKDAYIETKKIIGNYADLFVYDYPRSIIRGEDLSF